MNKINAFVTLSNLFKKNHFSLYLVGGTTRDFLLKKELSDMDVVTDATPKDMMAFLNSENANLSFQEYGIVKYKVGDCHFDIATLRKEKRYIDSRHPSQIEFVPSLKIDCKRRDFTINGMYLDDRFHLIDYVHGKRDLERHVIKMIGNPSKRFKEDPLRILRAIRFALVLNFEIDNHTKKAMIKKIDLLKKLNPQKINEEIHKIQNVDNAQKEKLFTDFGIQYLLDVIK